MTVTKSMAQARLDELNTRIADLAGQLRSLPADADHTVVGPLMVEVAHARSEATTIEWVLGSLPDEDGLSKGV